MKNNVPTCSGDIGNTSSISPSKNWCFTLNNYSNDDILEFTCSNLSVVSKYVFQEEKGENGTPHLQGYLQFTNKKRPFSVFKNKRIHWEKTRSVEHSIAYCSKIETRVGKIYTRGIDMPYEIHLKKFYNWELEIIELLKKNPDDRKINWYWEENGCAGKTTFSKWIYLNYPNTVVLSGKASDMKNAIVMYKEKNKQLPKIVIINIPRSNIQFVSYNGIEQIKDMFFFSGKYEGGMICGENPHVLVFANEEPDYDNLSTDRWHVVNISAN